MYVDYLVDSLCPTLFGDKEALVVPAELQMQLKLTSGPKKSALLMLRKKIEVQNDKVLAARESFHAARKVGPSHLHVINVFDVVNVSLGPLLCCSSGVVFFYCYSKMRLLSSFILTFSYYFYCRQSCTCW